MKKNKKKDTIENSMIGGVYSGHRYYPDDGSGFVPRDLRIEECIKDKKNYKKS